MSVRAITAAGATAVTAIGVVAAVVFAVAPARAGDFVVYRSFHADIEVSPLATVTVTETITVDFGVPRHGIFRDIPVRYEYEPSDRHDRVIRLDVLSVARADASGRSRPEAVEILRQGAVRRLKIGDPDVTLTGAQTYEVRYTVEGAMNSFPSHDELFWNVTGDEWEGAFERASVTVRGPATVGAECFSGPPGSTDPCEPAEPGVAFADAVVGSPGVGGMTVVVGFEPGSVDVPPPILVEVWSLRRAFSVNSGSVGGMGAVAGATLGVLVPVLRRGRDRAAAAELGGGEGAAAPPRRGLLEPQAAPVQFRPPEGLRPAHLGLVIDERVDSVDIGSTLVDLAVRGHLAIEDRRQPGKKEPDWWLVRRGPPEGDVLEPYEARLLDGLFGSRGTPDVSLSSLRGQFRSDYRAVVDMLYDDGVARGWFTRRPDRVRGRYALLGAAAVLLSAGAVVAAAAFTTFAWVPVPLVVGGLVLLVASRWMPYRTGRGRAVYIRTLGFRRFIHTSEAESLEFASRRGTFFEFLPFAVAFGLVVTWARAFRGLDLATVAASGWFVGSAHDPTASWSDFGRGFGETVGRSLAAVPASSGSSGFSGGSSGGGFGGGGGGSW